MIDIPTDWLAHSARNRPGGTALADGREELDYAELLRRAGRVAAGLSEAGVGPADPVAIDLPAGVEHAIALHGGILAGAVVQSLPSGGRAGTPVAAGAFHLGRDQLERFSSRAETALELRRHPGDPLTRVLSSGTSGDPKPVELTAANHLWSALASAVNLGIDPADRWLCCLPLNHVGGLAILLRSAIYGTAAVIHDGFDVDRVAAAIGAGEASVLSLVSTQLARLLDAGARIELPRLLLVGGGPVPDDVLAEALERGARVIQTYGLTEACSQVCTLAPHEAAERAGSAGRPLLGVRVAIADGEVLVRGPVVAPATVAVDGWLHTGDLGRLEEGGYLRLEGRREDLIVSGGENVRPERVEDAIRAHPGVAEVGVAGREDREWGQAVVAHVVASGPRPPDPEELRDFARARLERHEVPKRFELVGSLPRTGSGKLLRRLLT